jgi:hypothetical protein
MRKRYGQIESKIYDFRRLEGYSGAGCCRVLKWIDSAFVQILDWEDKEDTKSSGGNCAGHTKTAVAIANVCEAADFSVTAAEETQEVAAPRPYAQHTAVAF